ncbi:MAG TPA: hypothetical protein DD670_19720 [Planctomycetaceae bacterium]|nr:hypothetical protein [Planctomycetaceae bacterium]
MSVFREEVGGLVFSWHAPDNVFGAECKYGYINLLSPQQIISCFQDQKVMAEDARRNGFGNDPGWAAVIDDWPHWLPVFRFNTGDCLCVDIGRPAEQPIVFLEHDVMDGGPNLHGLRLASSLSDFVQQWAEAMFVELRDWTVGCNDVGLNLRADVFGTMQNKLHEMAEREELGEE